MNEPGNKPLKDLGFLDRLAEVASERDVMADPRWEALAAGELGAGDVEELRARAENTPVGRAAFEAMQPVGDAELDAMTEAALGTSRPGQPHRELSTKAAPRGRRAVFAAFGAALAAAAGALWLLRVPSPAPVGDYDLAIKPGDAIHRSTSPDGTLRFAPGSHFELIARPRNPVEGPLATRAALVRDGHSDIWTPPIRITSDGTAQVAGTREAIFPGVPDGDVEIWLAIGRPEALPVKLPPDAPGASDAAIRVLHVRISLGPDTGP